MTSPSEEIEGMLKRLIIAVEDTFPHWRADLNAMTAKELDDYHSRLNDAARPILKAFHAPRICVTTKSTRP